jgi:HPt (histidine-containing phosphotransfer) domain-containing protein
MDAQLDWGSDESVDPSTQPHFDPSQLQDLASVLPAAQVASLAHSYREAVAAILAALGEAAAASDFSALGEQAHDLKGVSGNFGARRLQYLAEALEHACAGGKPGDLGGTLAQMEASSAAAWRAIEAHLAA